MSVDDLGKLLTLGITLLGAYIAFISFTPKILEEYRKLIDEYRTKSSQQKIAALIEKEIEGKFGKIRQRIIKLTKYYSFFYLLTGIATGIILLNLIFSSIACRRLLCNLLWLPYVAGCCLLICLLYLLIVAAKFLELFAKVVENIENM
jgi:hypothetical protein